MAEEKSNKQVTAEQMNELLDGLAKSNREFAETLAQKIVHPDPTAEQAARRETQKQLRIEEARREEVNKQRKRKYCAQPASPMFPHRRSGQQWGAFAGSSVIAWKPVAFSQKREDGTTYDTPEVLIGVCQWCHTEFKPEDPDYQEAISWGINSGGTAASMNIHTGNWS